MKAKILSYQQQDIAIWLALQMKFETFQNSAKRQKTSEYEAHVTGESSRQVNEKEQEDDELLMKQVSQDIIEEVSLTINEAELKKIADEMLRQRCTSGDEHQYHIDRPEKIVLSLHKFHANIFNDVDIEERTSRWAERAWKTKEVVYSNSKIIQVIKTYWELGHEHKFITEIVARRANECIVSITEPDYKNLNKNDIEDIYLLIMNGKVPDYAETGMKSTICSASSMSHCHGIIYKNSKKEKRVMRHSEIHKFCDATLNRVLEGLKSYNNDVKYGYIQRDLIEDEVEYLKLFAEEIEVRLKYRNQMRRWEMYVNGKTLWTKRRER
ncbi:hypothetical protein Tco_0356987 [Tanacetum coccineum]